MQRTRIAVAAAGYIGQAHITVLQSSSTVSLCAVVDPSPAAQAIAASAGVACFSSVDDLLAQDQPEGIVLATPNALHLPQALQCITAGVPTMRLKTYVLDEDRSWWKPFEIGQVSMQRDDPIRLQMEHFGAVVRGECKPLVSARDGLQNLRITEAIAQAAQSGTTVKL
jgi:predicted dehydrogenase